MLFKINNTFNKKISYENLLKYDPFSWSQWTTLNTVKNQDGLEITFSDTSHSSAYIDTNLKNSTKYGLLFNLISYNLTSENLQILNYLTGSPIQIVTPPTTALGVIKHIFTTQANITTNRFRLYQGSLNDNSLKIKVANFRLIELKPGSKHEYNFNTISKDILNRIYPFK